MPEESTNAGQADSGALSHDDFATLGMESSGGQEIETPEDSSPETKKAEPAPSQEGEKSKEEDSDEVETPESESEENTPDEKKEVPLNKDKRFQEKVAEVKRLQEQTRQMNQQMEKMAQILEKLSAKETETKTKTEIPDAFLKTFGKGDAEADRQGWGAFRGILDYHKQEILAEVEQKISQKQSEERQWDSTLDEQVATLKQNGYEISKEELVSVLQEYEPSKGLKEYDFEKAIKIHQKDKKIAELEAKISQLGKQGLKEDRKGIAKKVGADNSNPKNKSEFTFGDFPRLKQMLGRK